ncbi:hypothetical protein AA106556_0966 [Neokomagataea tanensis NBRC 106556]|uniref:Uncharacterized protein n=1 Tax=Neokomagataea tanensis NBRC 106556 TaxID=1223519 RepID=A0ABQ0QIG4_9PROT|nr:hypothetical protein AA106556_0966 [Neokomagataea tanensis NBRC 106556]
MEGCLADSGTGAAGCAYATAVEASKAAQNATGAMERNEKENMLGEPLLKISA